MHCLYPELSTPSRAVLVPSHDGEVFHEEPMDAPGAMVEVVASTTPTTTPSSLDVRRGGKKLTPTYDYRKTLLLKYSALHTVQYTLPCMCQSMYVPLTGLQKIDLADLALKQYCVNKEFSDFHSACILMEQKFEQIFFKLHTDHFSMMRSSLRTDCSLDHLPSTSSALLFERCGKGWSLV